jgi:catechol 2,3-dioxygenase-like lactoylglutathione lyase family enzyme
MIIAIHHVQLAMPKGAEEDAVAFYQAILGIPQVPKPPDLADRGGCWFESARVKVHLGVDEHFLAARKAHPALLVDDLAHLADALAAAGYALNRDDPLEGYDRVYVDDPFGNRIELLQPQA